MTSTRSRPDVQAVLTEGLRRVQLDITKVKLRWFAPGAEFAFGSGVVGTPAEGGTEAVLSVIDGNVSIVSGVLPSYDYPQ
jgi:hypothetical protein